MSVGFPAREGSRTVLSSDAGGRRSTTGDEVPAVSKTLTVDVAITGASYAGLSLALALARTFGPRFSIALIDRQAPSAGPSIDPRASAISAASRRMLAALGIWDTIEGEAQDVCEILITDSSLEAGVRPILLSYNNQLDDGEAASSIVPNSALGRALEAAVATHPSIHRLSSVEAVSFETSGPFRVVALSDGTMVRGSLLVAADGRRSRAREAAGIKCVGWSYDQIGIVTRVKHELPHQGRAIQHFLPGGPFAILPLKGNESCITWSEDATRAREVLALDDEGFLAEADKRFTGRLGALTLSGPRASWPLEMHLARQYVALRLALVGDAAHGVHPIAGQGLNLAFRDVAALVESIAEGIHVGLDAGDTNILSRYEQWRRFDSMTSASAFDALNKLFAVDWPLARSAREAGLGLVDRMPDLKRWFVAEAAGTTGDLPKLLRGEPV